MNEKTINTKQLKKVLMDSMMDAITSEQKPSHKGPFARLTALTPSGEKKYKSLYKQLIPLMQHFDMYEAWKKILDQNPELTNPNNERAYKKAF